MEASTSEVNIMCSCKSLCATKRRENSSRGCPCKAKNILCSDNCKCGTRKTSCKNRENIGETRERLPRRSKASTKHGFRGLTQRETINEKTEDQQRCKENSDVKDFINKLDEETAKKLAIRSLRRGIGSMDYIHTLLTAEDDLDENPDEQEAGETSEQHESLAEGSEAHSTAAGEIPPWCVCSNCRPMPQDTENKCCNLKKCITSSSRFSKICLDPDVLELCIRNTSDIRNDREDNSTRSFRKAAYRQFILSRYGYLGKGNRRVCPSCVVFKIRQHYPSLTGVYMGYRER